MIKQELPLSPFLNPWSLKISLTTTKNLSSTSSSDLSYLSSKVLLFYSRTSTCVIMQKCNRFASTCSSVNYMGKFILFISEKHRFWTPLLWVNANSHIYWISISILLCKICLWTQTKESRYGRVFDIVWGFGYVPHCCNSKFPLKACGNAFFI